jgi:CubicO group peptidase (beta-lactamase class C family)
MNRRATPLSVARACALLVLLVPCFACRTESARGFDEERLERVTEFARGVVERGEHAGVSVLVTRDGKTALEASFGVRDADTGAPMTSDTIVRIYSMTKVITCVAALQLVEDGVLQLDAPVTRWLPELGDLQVLTGGTPEAPELAALERPITVKHLLNHTAGFTYDIFGDSPVNELYRRADLWSAQSVDEFLAKVRTLPLIAQPGTGFHYGISDDVLGAVIERASGTTLEEHFARRITGPLGMTDTAFDVPAEKMHRLARLHEHRDGRFATTPEIVGAHAEPGRGFASGGGGIFSTIGDYARFAQCLMQGGTLDGARVLGRKTVELALANSLPPGVLTSGGLGWGLFSGVRLELAASGELGSVGTFSWSGIATTHFFADPREGVVGLIVCQHLPFDEHGVFVPFRNAVYQALD